MPFVKMIKTKSGSIDGLHVKKFFEGRTYQISDALANVFINQLECAEEVMIKKEQPIKAKAIAEAPMNKAAIVPENKDEYIDDDDNAMGEEFESKSVARRITIIKNKKKKDKRKGRK